MADEEIIVKIDPEQDQLTQTTGTTIVDVADPAVKDLMQQYKALEDKDKNREAELAAERKRRELAEREANEARQAVHVANTKVVESNLDTVDTAIAAAKTEVDSARATLKAAIEAGDIDGQVEAQDRIATARAKMLRLDEAKSDLHETKEKAKTAPAPRPVSVDPIEAYINGRSEPTKNWLRAHPDWVTDANKNKKLTAAHYDAEASGLSVDSPQYFEHVENFIGLTKTAPDKGPSGATTVTGAKRMSPPVAPAANFGGGTNGGSSAEVHLTQGEARSAQDGTLVWNYNDPSGQNKFKKGDPIGVQEMARRKRAMSAQGVYDKVYVDQ